MPGRDGRLLSFPPSFLQGLGRKPRPPFCREGTDPDALPPAIGQQHAQREDACRDDQRLGDGGVADGRSVGDRSVLDEVDADGLRHAHELAAIRRIHQPGFEEAGGLRPLTWAYDDDHHPSLSTFRSQPL